jgi:hypothetical protein
MASPEHANSKAARLIISPRGPRIIPFLSSIQTSQVFASALAVSTARSRRSKSFGIFLCLKGS